MTHGRIDTHQHVLPPKYRAQLDAHNLTAGGWPTPAWSAEAAIALSDELNIATAVLSVSAPGMHWGDDGEARVRAREANEYVAELVKDRPDRFGMFASLTLPDVDGALAEVAYAFDELGADGVVVLSNAHGTYLGDSSLNPLWEELDARSAVVFVHPTEPPVPMLPGLPSPLLDYPFDTTRTALHLVANGVLRRHPNLRIILSHAGGFLPYAAYRFLGAAGFNPGITEDTVLEDLRRFYFDTALSSSLSALPSLLAFADPTHLTFGSDFPFAPDPGHWTGMLDAAGLSEETAHAINRGNAEALFPRLAQG